MKKVLNFCLVAVIVIMLIAVGSLSVMATSLDSSEVSQDTIRQEIFDIDASKVEINRLTEEATEVATTETTEETSENEEKNDELVNWEQVLSAQTKKNGLYYYIQRYQYDCKIVYMEKYVLYLEQQVDAYQKMYDLGEITESVLQLAKAQKSKAETERDIARNERAYNNLYLEKNALDYSDYKMTEFKEVQSIDYYVEKYPKKDYMVLARHVTDYNNAVLNINAQQLEIKALEKEVEMAKLLLKEGEISQLEFGEKDIQLAQAQYELEQYYVNMNLAYYNLEEECE